MIRARIKSLVLPCFLSVKPALLLAVSAVHDTPPPLVCGPRGYSTKSNSTNPGAGLGSAFLAGKLSLDELWYSGVRGQVQAWAARGQGALKGREEVLVGSIRSQYQELMKKHVDQQADLPHATRVNLQYACLAVATKRVLTTEGIDVDLVDQHLKLAMGGLHAPLVSAALSGQTWIKVKLFRKSPLDVAGQLLAGVAKDLQGVGSCELLQLETGSELVIRDCVVHGLLQQENAVELLSYFCCQEKPLYLQPLAKYGVEAQLRRCKAWGDDDCCLAVQEK